MFPQHLVEGLLNFRRRVCRSFWLDLAFQDPPGKTDQYYYTFFYPPHEIKHSSDFLMIFHDFSKPKNKIMTKKSKFEKNLVEKNFLTENLGKKELAATARQSLPPKKNKIPRTLLEVFGT